MNIQWDAEGYVKQFQFVHEYGNDVLPLLDLHPGQTVLDLGCGNGALTKTLAEMGVNAVGWMLPQSIWKLRGTGTRIWFFIKRMPQILSWRNGWTLFFQMQFCIGLRRKNTRPCCGASMRR